VRASALRPLVAVAGLIGSLVAGTLFGRWRDDLLAGILLGACLALTVLLVLEMLRARRLIRWLRRDAEGPAPDATAAPWVEVVALMTRALRRRERAAEAERQRLEQFLAAVEASPIGVLLLDADERITWFSRAAADHLGLQPQRDLQQHVTNLVRAPAFVEQLHGPPGDLPVVFAGSAGGRLSSLIRPYGDGLRLVLTQDVTERERAEAMRRNFVANVSHEIRTPLTVLAGFVDTMRQLPLSEAERRRVLALMAEQAGRMQHLVSDLLTLAQLEGSPRPPADRWTPVAKLRDRALADGRQLSGGRHELSAAGGDDAQIAGDENELQSALTNLVVNAVRYTPDGGRIEIAWSWADNGGGALSVRDDGVGIAKEHLPRLTERFYRVDGSRSRETGGTGLGLSIVKHVVQRHGGEIDIDSEPGRGSLFRLLLPPGRVRRGADAARQDAEAASVG
jgi:two-component system phosphate regulon sensor histidine kinase PhoR